MRRPLAGRRVRRAGTRCCRGLQSSGRGRALVHRSQLRTQGEPRPAERRWPLGRSDEKSERPRWSSLATNHMRGDAAKQALSPSSPTVEKGLPIPGAVLTRVVSELLSPGAASAQVASSDNTLAVTPVVRGVSPASSRRRQLRRTLCKLLSGASCVEVASSGTPGQARGDAATLIR